MSEKCSSLAASCRLEQSERATEHDHQRRRTSVGRRGDRAPQRKVDSAAEISVRGATQTTAGAKPGTTAGAAVDCAVGV